LADGPLIPADDGLQVVIRLTLRAKADRVIAVAAAAEGRQVVKVCVAAPAADGRASEALLRLLARAWRLPRRDPAIGARAASRHKRVRVAGDPWRLLDRLGALIAALPGR
jgi:uncharacterized protein